MNSENTSIRLKRLMQYRHLRQVDILEMAKPYCDKYNFRITKSDLSQYVSGTVKPGQEKLTMLGMALNVSEAWLLGLDVPMERTKIIKEIKPPSSSPINTEEQKLLDNFNKLNSIGKLEATKRIGELTDIPKYTKPDDSIRFKTEDEAWEYLVNQSIFSLREINLNQVKDVDWIALANAIYMNQHT